MSCVVDSSTVSMMRRRWARSELPVSVASTMASASSGGLISVAPHENSTLDRHVPAGEVATGHADQLGGDGAAGKVLGAPVGRVLRDGKDPAHRAAALLGVGEVADGDHVETAFERPSQARSSPPSSTPWAT